MRINDIQRIEDNHKFICLTNPWKLNKEYFWNLNPDDVPFPKLKRLIRPVYEFCLDMGKSRTGERKKYQGKPSYVGGVWEINDTYKTSFTPWSPTGVLKGINDEYPVPWNKKLKKYLMEENQKYIDEYLEKYPNEKFSIEKNEQMYWFIKEFDKPPSCEELLNEMDLLVGKSGDYHHNWLSDISYSDSKGESLTFSCDS